MKFHYKSVRKKPFGLFSIFLTALFIFGGAAFVLAEKLPVKNYTSADGLGSSFVDTLKRDSRGFMWFATRGGLSRFDGTKFVTYQVGTENAAPGVESIYETRKGVYWILTTGRLCAFAVELSYRKVISPLSFSWIQKNEKSFNISEMI